ncbi:hypothetical protein, partial [Streptomyces huasconensis]|uniref:hypothetical protein n=1 Tax=Streptomyces huasconensis TaxID=1854574 RepID=UPI00340E2260
FLCTHPLGLSSGRFPSVFRVSNLTRSVFRSVSGSDFISGGRWGAFAFRLFRLYQKFSAGLTGSKFRLNRGRLLN